MKTKMNQNERSIFKLVIYVKQALKIHKQILEARVIQPGVYRTCFSIRKRRNSEEMASDALWIVSFKCIVKGY